MGPSGSVWAAAGQTLPRLIASNRKAQPGIIDALQGQTGAEDIIIVSMGPQPIFTLQQARDLLPQVKHLTADAVRRAEGIAAQLNGLPEDDPDYAILSAALRDVVNGWAD